MAEFVRLYCHRPGLQTLIQDHGRVGFQAFGVPVSGVMDSTSAHLANWLVGNSPDTPLLEIALSGPSVQLDGRCQMAITGADLSPTIDGLPVAMYQTIDVREGSMLSFGRLRSGCRAYVAIGGEWEVQGWLGSKSAALFLSSELTTDSIISKNSLITIRPGPSIQKRMIAKDLRPVFSGNVRARVLPGPEFEAFSNYAIAYFFSSTFRLSSHSNRMGYRLHPALTDFEPDREIISSGIVPGTIQIANSGQPILLMADAQTTGGYYRIANAITADLDQLAQLKPGDELEFSLVKPEEAHQLLRERAAYWARIFDSPGR